MSTKTQPIGRPKSEDKRRAILESARELFLRDGYSTTSIETIAQHAGVGKPTIYSHFGSKRDLFVAVVGMRSEVLLAKLRALGDPSDSPRKDLIMFAMVFQQMILNPDARRWDRLVIGEAGRHPELAQTLFKAGPTRVLKKMQSYMQHQADQGRLQIDDSATAAEHFLGLILGLELIRSLLASQPRRTEAYRRERAERLVDVFLASYGIQERDGNV